jgi:hypothetical protein
MLAAGLLVAEARLAAEPDIISLRPAQVLDVRNGKLRRDVVVQIQGERILSVDSARGIESNPLEDVANLEDVRFVMLGARVVKSSGGTHP